MIPTCGRCQDWQIIDVTPIAAGEPRDNHLGRCRSGQVPGWARARRQADSPYRDGDACFRPQATAPQDYAAYAARPPEEKPMAEAIIPINELAHRLAREMAESAIMSNGLRCQHDGETWWALTHKDDPLLASCVDYLAGRGRLIRNPRVPSLVRVLGESESEYLVP